MSDPAGVRSGSPSGGRRIGTGTRLALALQVGLAGLLAVAAAAVVIDVSDWWYVRFDLSEGQSNTLEPEVRDLIERLPEDVTIDVFYRPFVEPYAGVSGAAHARMLDYLRVAVSAHRNRLSVNLFGPRDLEKAQLRQDELGVRGDNVVVFTCGERSTTLGFFSDIAAIDWGNPSRRGLEYLQSEGITGVVDPRTWDPTRTTPPRFNDFRGEEAFAQALLKVSSGARPRIYFTVGHGEASLESPEAEGLSQLVYLLGGEFEIASWDAEETGNRVPEDCDVLVLAGPRQPLGPETSAAIHTWVENGGRLLAAPHHEELSVRFDEGLTRLMGRWGMISRHGIVCEPIVDVTGARRMGYAECAQFRVGENRMDHSHELAQLERRHNRKLTFVNTSAIEAQVVPGGRFPTRLVVVPPDSWLDLPNQSGYHDWTYDPRTEEKNANLALVCTLELGAALQGTGVERPRIVGLGNVGMLCNAYLQQNRDFVRNLFDWLAGREHRLRVTPRDPAVSRLELQRTAALPVLTYGLWIGFPGACIAMGLVLGWKRRRG